MVRRRRIFLKTGIYACCLTALVGGRGNLLASMMDGRYRVGDWILDVVALGTLILALYGVDISLKWLTSRIVPMNRSGARAFQTTVRVLFLVVIGFPFLLATLQIHPQRIVTTKTPDVFGLPFEEITISSDSVLKGWWIPNEQAGAIVLVAHGLNANRQNFLPPAEMLYHEGFAVLIFDFPAHGDSGGRQTTLGLNEATDIKAAYDWIRHLYPDKPIHALGYSMGASALITAETEYHLFDRIIVDGTFSSIRSVADATMLKFAGPLKGVLWSIGCFWIRVWTGSDLNQHRPVERIRQLNPQQLFIIHGTDDPVIPFAESDKLYEATGRKAERWIVHGAVHAGTLADPDYSKRLAAFFMTGSSRVR